ncbi:MAG: N-acetylmuramoyl-L-alanine amidase [Bacteroidetes bacterium]|uniref:N-acetylmuramoyl-L-alanine amidase n=1 Tax=Candidatus Cryptobacteroides merdigallinarum TaxID=2840770 RepID=A0A9D9HGH1_9BACT|nr:N-acetylmuramoyl-L-alanine amidase [Candidatus Cryptobacteroides merdigallinarum]
MKTRHHISGMAVLSLLLIFLFPAPLSADSGNSLRLKTVVIDAGHGGKDPGCVSRDGRVLEKTVNLDIARKLGAKISAYYPDVKVIYTRTTDVFVTLNNRADIANRNNADLFISIHVNASTSTQPHGFSTHILGNGKSDNFSANMDVCRRENSVILLEDDYTTDYQGFNPEDPESFIFFNLMQSAFYEQSLAFAAEADKEMLKGPVKHSRGISQDPLWVLWRTGMPAVLVEVGFMSNASDLKILNSATNRDAIAQRLFNAFRSFKAKYDASLDFTAGQPVQDVAHTGQGGGLSVPGSGEDGYGVQVFVLGKRLQPGDKAFKGYDVVPVKAGNVYKYIIKVSSADEARSLFRKTRKTFPGSFPVKIENGKVSAL